VEMADPKAALLIRDALGHVSDDGQGHRTPTGSNR